MSNCSDNGIWIDDLRSCNCSTGWSGEHCGSIVCFNNGTPNALGRWCNCPLVFTGRHCHHSACELGSLPYDNFTACQCPDGEHYSGKLCSTLWCENGGTAVGPQCVCTVWYSEPYCRERSAGYYLAVAFAAVLCLLFVGVVLKNVLWAIMKRRRGNKDESNNNNGSTRSLAGPANFDHLLLTGAETSVYSSTADNGSVKFAARNGRDASIMSDALDSTMQLDKAGGSRKLRHY